MLIPVPATKLPVEDLAGTGQRERSDEFGTAGGLVPGDVLLADLPQFFRRGLLAGTQHDHGVNAFAEVVVGYADDRAGLDGRVLCDDLLDLDAVDVLSPADDHVLDPVDDVDVAVIVHVAAVAGVHPAVPDRGAALPAARRCAGSWWSSGSSSVATGDSSVIP